MNQIQTINTEYLRSSRTIETIMVSDNKSSVVFFLYNYEGNSFRLFSSHVNLINFFLNKCESDFHFCSEIELDDFLVKIKLIAWVNIPLKASSSTKTDITIVDHDQRTNQQTTLGFSIKSKLGSSSTLL